ncbi:MAG TPA: DUF4870 domain-containing protein [Verrucomicrobiae bacterium]|nr:DUF4870 domain-containing protein [Verrucomicrobiae bacterium]
MGNEHEEKTSTGLQANVAALACYALGWITGLIFYLLEKENKFVRFHAFQSIVAFGALTALQIILAAVPVIGWTLLPLIYLAQLALWIFMMIKAYQGEKFKLPVAGDLAEKNA